MKHLKRKAITGALLVVFSIFLSFLSLFIIFYLYLPLFSFFSLSFSLFFYLSLISPRLPSSTSLRHSLLYSSARVPPASSSKPRIFYTIPNLQSSRLGDLIDWNAQFQRLLQLPEYTDSLKLEKYEQLSALSKVSLTSTISLSLVFPRFLSLIILTSKRISYTWRLLSDVSSFPRHIYRPSIVLLYLFH